MIIDRGMNNFWLSIRKAQIGVKDYYENGVIHENYHLNYNIIIAFHYSNHALKWLDTHFQFFVRVANPSECFRYQFKIGSVFSTDFDRFFALLYTFLIFFLFKMYSCDRNTRQ